MEIVPFRPAHLAQVDPPAMTAWQARRCANGYRSRGPAYTAIEGGAVLACAGVVVDHGVGRAWAFLSDAVRDRPMVLHRQAKRGLARVEREFRLRRIVATVYEDFAAGRRWLEHLGFREEGILTDHLGTGVTYLRYVK